MKQMKIFAFPHVIRVLHLTNNEVTDSPLSIKGESETLYVVKINDISNTIPYLRYIRVDVRIPSA